MSKVRIVTDSTAYLTREYARQHKIRIVPLSVTFSGVTGDEGFPGGFEDFYRQLETSGIFPPHPSRQLMPLLLLIKKFWLKAAKL